jgi:hypothetical protein
MLILPREERTTATMHIIENPTPADVKPLMRKLVRVNHTFGITQGRLRRWAGKPRTHFLVQLISLEGELSYVIFEQVNIRRITIPHTKDDMPTLTIFTQR